MFLVTFDQVKAFLDLSKSTLEDYPDLEFLIDSMESVFEDYCYRKFEVMERESKTIFTTEEDKVALFGVPIISVASVFVGGEEVDYQRSDNVIKLGSVVPAYTEIIITYTGGLYLTTETVPKDLNIAAIRQVAFEYQNRETIGVTKQIIDGNTNEVENLGLIKYTKMVLDRYINYAVKH